MTPCAVGAMPLGRPWAVIAAHRQGDPADKLDRAMTGAIQDAYYRRARNPSDNSTLIDLTAEHGLDLAMP